MQGYSHVDGYQTFVCCVESQSFATAQQGLLPVGRAVGPPGQFPPQVADTNVDGVPGRV